MAKLRGGARIDEKHELEGMDISCHRESQINIDKNVIEDL